MATMATTVPKQSMYKKDMLLDGHEDINREKIDGDDSDSNSKDLGWEISLTQHNNQIKPEPGCRQILYKKMKLRLSCEPVNSSIEAELYVHQTPCIFCRILAFRAEENLEYLIQRNNNNGVKQYSPYRRGRRRRRENGVRSGSDKGESQACTILSESNTMVKHIITPFLSPSERTVLFDIPEFCDIYHLKDHCCPKHGNTYKPDDQIFKVPPKYQKMKGDKNCNSDVEGDYLMFGEILETIIREGKDPIVFQNKLDFRTQPFPPHMFDDDSINMPEISLAEDPDYGRYFRMMKKCIKCEKEAEARLKAKKGLIRCGFCTKYHLLSDEKNCSECHGVLSCKKCSKNAPHKCGQCQLEFCQNCRKVKSCGSCEKSSCEGCIETAEFDFVECSICKQSMCSDCNITYSCEICGEVFCYYCRDGGLLDNTMCCTKCKPQKSCDFCGERKCLDCYDMEDNMNCSICGGSSCKTCNGLYKCEGCEQSFCHYCREQNPKSNCKNCKKKVSCSHCGGQYSCGSCGKAQCRMCSKSKERCKFCHRFSCDSCGVVESCTQCGVYFCPNCKPADDRSCADCGGHLCPVCRDNINLTDFQKCQGCGDDHCGLCRTTDRCDTCKGLFCSKCTTKCKISGLVNCKVCMTKLDEFYHQFW